MPLSIIKNMRIRKKLIIALIAFGVLPHLVTGFYAYSLVESIISGELSGTGPATHSIGWFFVVIAMSGTGGFILLGVILSRGIASPMENILKHLKEIAPDEFTFDAEGTNNELHLLEQNVNNVFDKLYERKNELREANLKLEEGNRLLKDQSRTLSVHNDLLYMIFSSNSMDEMGAGFISKLREYISLKGGGIYFGGADGDGEMAFIAGDGINGDVIIKAVKGLTGKVVEEKKSISIKWSEVDPEGDVALMFKGMEQAEVLCSPIVSYDMTVRGMLILGGESFSDQDEEFANFAAFVLGMGLEKSYAELKLKELATDLRIKGEVLTTKNVELMEIDSIRSEFVSLVSHELRTPLNAIIGFSEILLDSIAGELNDKQTECVRDILGSGLHLLQIVNDILDLSKIEAGFVDIENEKINILEEIASVERTLSPLISKKNQTINVHAGKGLTEIVSDGGKLNQVLLNLISNASKFSPDASEIDVRINRKKEMVEVAVEDRGIGIEQKDLKRLFRPFVQVDSSHSRNYEGTGLGLAISKKFIEALGGTIKVESSPGAGSTFSFSIRDNESSGNEITEKAAERQSFFSKYEEEVRLGRFDPLLSSKLILIFAGEKYDVASLTSQLESGGYEVILFHDDRELLRVANMLSPFIVSLNFLHPAFDGKVLLEKLKQEPFISELPLFVLTEDAAGAMSSEKMGNIMKLGGTSLKDIRFFVNGIEGNC